MASHAMAAGRPGRVARIGRVLLHELRAVLPPTIFFFLCFNLILFTKRLILADHLIQFAGFFIATMSALVVGKVVLVADKIPFLRRCDHLPLAAPILFKTVIYTLLVFVARLLEAFVHYVAEGGVVGRGGFIEHQIAHAMQHQRAAAQVIENTPRRAYHKIDAALQAADLCVHRPAAVNGQHVQIGVGRQFRGQPLVSPPPLRN